MNKPGSITEFQSSILNLDKVRETSRSHMRSNMVTITGSSHFLTAPISDNNLRPKNTFLDIKP